MKYIVDVLGEKTEHPDLKSANTHAVDSGYGFPDVRIIEVE